MARFKSSYVCQQCGYETYRWLGKCPECGSWNTMVETVIEQTTKNKQQRNTSRVASLKKPIYLSSVKLKDTKRTSTKISELDRVLGGGLVPGQVVLMAGEPGIGKSTILLQLADQLGDVLYASGEESVNQIKIRAQRLGVRNKNIRIYEETDIDQIISQVSSSNESKVLVVDSIQTVATSDLSGMAGSVGQVRECTYRLVKLAKSQGLVVFIVGHVTKQGSIAGPSVLMHLVDTVLWFEGDKTLSLRLLRARKNRFGPTDEVGIFSMEDIGLKSVDDSGKMFITYSGKNVSGSVVTSVMEGTRPILVEIQALVNPTKMAYPKRIAQGFDSKKLEMLLAVLQRRSGLPLYESDVFANIMGGFSLRNDPSADLAICMAIASAYFDKPLPGKSLVLGEVGLLGDIRDVVSQEKRVKEAKRLGYSAVVSSKSDNYIVNAVKRLLRK